MAEGEVLDLGRVAREGTAEVWLPGTLRGLLQAGDEGLSLVRRIVERVASAPAQVLDALRSASALLPAGTPLAAPVPDPRLVVAAGLAYKSHLAEMSGTPQPPHPTAFMKSPHSITSPESIVSLPAGADMMVDYEGEMALVFGRRCHRVSPQQAMACIAGCTVANDISARDWVKDVWSASSPWDARRTWEVNIMGKQFPGFTPLGPCLVTMDEIADVRALQLTTRLNGHVVQSAKISDLIFELADTIAFLSRWYEFHPGDVLLTGTPAGVGAGRKPQLFMRHGDVIEVEIDRIGVLRNRLQVEHSVTH
jgi:acylpyruvate hydrolase